MQAQEQIKNSEFGIWNLEFGILARIQNSKFSIPNFAICSKGLRYESLLTAPLAARGESLAAFDGRCIPAGCVAPPSNTPGILGRHALPTGRLARLGATPDLHHGLLAAVAIERAPRAAPKALVA